MNEKLTIVLKDSLTENDSVTDVFSAEIRGIEKIAAITKEINYHWDEYNLVLSIIFSSAFNLTFASDDENWVSELCIKLPFETTHAEILRYLEPLINHINCMEAKYTKLTQ